MGLSPWVTTIWTCVWLSEAVENTSVLLVGTVVFLGIMGVAIFPIVSIAKVNGVTSSRRISLTSPPKTPPWIAAPTATTSSGLTDWFGVLPKKSFTTWTTLGILVIPPTIITSSRSWASSLASLRQSSTGLRVFWIRSSTRLSILARVSFIVRWSGCPSRWVM